MWSCFDVVVEFGSRGDAGIDVDHLLGQNWNADAEPDDGGSHVVRQPNHRS